MRLFALNSTLVAIAWFVANVNCGTTGNAAPPHSKPEHKKDATADDKQQVQAERIADQILARLLLRKIPGANDFAIERFPLLDEPLNLRFARCAELKYGDFGTENTVGAAYLHILEAQIIFAAALQADPNVVQALLKSQAEEVVKETKDEKHRKSIDEAEHKYNQAINADRAKKIVQIAEGVKDQLKPSEFMDFREKIKQEILKSINTIKPFSEIPETSDELRKSRERASELIKLASEARQGAPTEKPSEPKSSARLRDKAELKSSNPSGPEQRKADSLGHRVWRHKDGRTAEAEFLRFEEGIVFLRRKSDGSVHPIPLGNLAEDDQQWIRAQSSQKAGSRLPSNLPLMSEGTNRSPASLTQADRNTSLPRDAMIGHWRLSHSAAAADNLEFKGTVSNDEYDAYISRSYLWRVRTGEKTQVAYDILKEDAESFWLLIAVIGPDKDRIYSEITFSPDKKEMYVKTRHDVSRLVPSEIATLVKSQLGDSTLTTTYRRIDDKTAPFATGQDKTPNMRAISILKTLLGKSQQSKEFTAFRKELKGDPKIDKFGGDFYYSWHGEGISFSFGEDLLSTIFIYADTVDEYKQYRGELPEGLSFSDTRRDVEKKLGQPPRSGGSDSIPYWASYPAKGLDITYTSKDTNDLANTIHYITITPVNGAEDRPASPSDVIRQFNVDERDAQQRAEAFVTAMRERKLETVLAYVHPSEHESIKNEIAKRGFFPVPPDTRLAIEIKGDRADVSFVPKKENEKALEKARTGGPGFDMMKRDGKWWVTK